MTEKEFISKFLNINHENNSISTLGVALRGAREITARDVETGYLKAGSEFENLEKECINNTYNSNRFLGIINYLIIIDLFGCVLKKINKNTTNDNFSSTLNNFSELGKEEIKSLKNLRNALAHKFSLGNESEIFTIHYHDKGDKVIQPKENSYHAKNRKKPKNSSNYTNVNYINLCELVESIYAKIKELNLKGEIEILNRYKEGDKIKENDLISMYTIK